MQRTFGEAEMRGQGDHTHRLRSVAAALLALGASAALPAVAAEPAVQRNCIVIDSDGGLDDFRAVATLAPTGRIAAIVMTEGLARPTEGAAAMRAFLDRSGKSIPVLAGAAANPDRGYAADPRLGAWRTNTERLNGVLPEPAAAQSAPEAPEAPTDIGFSLRRYTASCTTISLLVIGPWTSFMRYAADVLGRIDRLVAQGRPYPDELGGEPNGFNCLYDLPACYTAHDLLMGRQLRAGRRLRADWVDIPNGPERCGEAEPGVGKNGIPIYAFSPAEAWFDPMAKAGGMASIVAEVMRNNLEGLKETSLWDDLVALYLLNRDVFVQRGGHFEPCVPSDTIRAMLTEAMAKR